MRKSRQSRAGKSNRVPIYVPLLHRGVVVLGLTLFVIWITLMALATVVSPVVPFFSDSTRELSTILIVLSIAFTAFGVGCELILCTVAERDETKAENERLSDLCGRSRFERPKRKYKRIRIEREDPVAP